MAVVNDGWERTPDGTVPFEEFHERGQGFGDVIRGSRLRSRYPMSFRENFTGRHVDNSSFDAGASDVDSKRRRGFRHTPRWAG